MKIILHDFEPNATLRSVIENHSGFHTPLRYAVADGYANNASRELELLMIVFVYHTDVYDIKNAYGVENFRSLGEIRFIERSPKTPHDHYQMSKNNSPTTLSLLKNQVHNSYGLESCLEDTLNNGDVILLTPEVKHYYPESLRDYISLKRAHLQNIAKFLEVESFGAPSVHKKLPHIQDAENRARGKIH